LQPKPDERAGYREISLREAQMVMFEILKEIDRICKKHQIRYWLDAGTLLGAVRHQGFIPWDDDLDIGMLREDYEKFLKVAPRELTDPYFLQTKENDPFPGSTYMSKVLYIHSFYWERWFKKNESFQQCLFVDIFPFDRYPSRRFLLFMELRNLLAKKKISYPRNSPGNLWWRFILLLTKVTFIFSLMKFSKYLVDRNRSNLLNKPGYQYVSYSPMAPWKEPYLLSEIMELTTVTFEGQLFPAPGDWDHYLTKQHGDYMQLPPEGARVPPHSKQIMLLDEKSNVN
jgi:lipopolysaccharide cholinephosphotransferase